MKKERYLEFDIARTIALILMPVAHFLECARNMDTIDIQTIETNKWILYIASFGAFVFMIMLGVNILLTSKNKPKELLIRGMKTFSLGIILNVLRYIIPSILAYFVTNDVYYIDYALKSSLASDILYFAALCFIFFALIKKFKIESIYLLLITIILAIFDFFMPKNIINNEWLSCLLGNFIHLDYLSAFALCQWLIVPVIGYIFGELYLNFRQRQQTSLFYKYLFLIGIIALIILTPILKLLGIDILEKIGGEYLSYSFDLWGVLILLIWYCILQPLVYQLSMLIKRENVKNFFINFSNGITVYYFIQWVLICWCQLILGTMGYSFDRYIGNDLFWTLTILIILFSYLLMKLFIKKFAK